jgi:hypothetical protein
MAQGLDFSIQLPSNIESPMLIDEVSSNEIYIGVSANSKDISKDTWKIKRICKSGSEWSIGFPNGSQEFGFAWDCRFGFTYSA